MHDERSDGGRDRRLSAATRGGIRPALVGGGIALAYVVGVTIWMYLHPNDDTLRTNVSDIVPIPLHFLAVGVLIGVARRTPGKRQRRAWTLLAVAFGLYAVGDIIWCVLEVGFGQSPFPSIADGFYLSYYPLLAAGLLRFSERPTERSQR